jgi:V8-like Glu-specific endopeptidase
VYQLVQQNWLIDHSEYSPLDKMADTGRQEPPPDKLDYALLRVEGEPGNDPVGGTKNKDPNAESRGWIKSPTSAHDFVPDTAVLIMQHPQGATLKLAWETQSVISVNEKKSRVRYRTNTEPGSSGSPCFDANWNLIALHHLGDASYDGFNQPEYNQGIPFNTILDLLEKREKKDELGK